MPGTPAVILTQEAADNELLAEQLAAHGISAQSYPCLATRLLPFTLAKLPPGRGLPDYRVVAFTSKRGVAGFNPVVQALRESTAAVACVGSTTAAAVRDTFGIEPDLIAETPTGEGLALAIAEAYPSPGVMLVVRGNKSTGTMQDALRERGWTVDEVVVYEQVPIDPQPLSQLENGIVVFASPSAAELFFGVNQHLLKHITCVAIGGTTALSLQALGATTIVTAEQPTHQALITAVGKLLEEAKTQ